MNEEDKKDCFLIVRITKAIKQRLTLLAKKNGVSFSGLVRHIITTYFKNGK
ncbi:MAG: hypothetical protein GWP19_03320 [Planctomycetia bacterium]|nr:hypothetical protein [Planctomycetia bacterium]